MSLLDKYNTQNRALDRLEKSYERRLLQNYQQSLKEVRAQIQELYNRSNGSFSEAAKFNRLANLEKSIAKEIGKLTGKNARTLQTGLGDMYVESFYRTAFVVESELGGARLGFGGINPKTIERAVDNPLDRVGFLKRNRDNQAVLTRQLNERITQGLIQGKSYGDIAKDITERFNVGANKAVRIAQTEAHRIKQQGRNDCLLEAQSAGVIMKKRWVATLGDNTRDTHAKLDGQSVKMDEQFEVNGLKADMPGGFGVAEEDINCQCDHIGEIEGYEPQTRAARSIEGKTELIQYQNFEEWHKNRIA